MRVLFYCLIGLTCCCAIGLHAGEQRLRQRPVRLIMDVNPGAIMISPELEGFEIRSNNSSEKYFSDEINLPVSQTPNVRLGLNFGNMRVQTAFMAGMGNMINSDFQGSFYTGEVALRIQTRDESIMIVPRLGLIRLNDAKWTGREGIKLRGDTGLFGGVQILQGGERISFSFGMNYVDAKYGLKLAENLEATNDALRMTGLWLNFGVTLRL